MKCPKVRIVKLKGSYFPNVRHIEAWDFHAKTWQVVGEAWRSTTSRGNLWTVTIYDGGGTGYDMPWPEVRNNAIRGLQHAASRPMHGWMKERFFDEQ